jgi:Zn-dependent protease with chaperone function
VPGAPVQIDQTHRMPRSSSKQPTSFVTLDHRRAWARCRAPVWFLLGAAVVGACAATVGLAVLLLVARGYSFFTSTRLRDAPVWNWTAGTTTALGVMAVGVAIAAVAVQGLFGTRQALRSKLGARPVQRGLSPQTDRLVNVVEALCVGLGITLPALGVIDDPAPNAVSLRSWRVSTLIATTGLLDVPRDELEAVCAHELAHLNAVDARWSDAATVSLGRAKRSGAALVAVGVGVAYLGFKVELWSLGVFGLGLVAIGSVTVAGVSRVLPQLRAEADAVADVAAIELARNPAALGAVCARLAADARVVSRRVPQVEHAWFKLVPDGSTDVSRELRRRAKAAYSEARVLPPPTAPSRVV